MQGEGQFKRKAERFYLYQFMDVIDQHSRKHLGYVNDFSTDGIMFITNWPNFAINQVREVYITNNIEDEPVTISAVIEVRWTKPNITPQMTSVGCRFLAIDDANKQLLEETGKGYSLQWT
jgi:Tfp pilus assembly protein PilZ